MGQSTSSSQLRKRHAELEDQVQGLWNMLHLFEKATKLFEGSVFTVQLCSNTLVWQSKFVKTTVLLTNSNMQMRINYVHTSLISHCNMFFRLQMPSM